MSDTLKPAFGLIGNALKSTAADHIVAVADDLYDESIATNLDLYGGFYARLYNKTNCF